MILNPELLCVSHLASYLHSFELVSAEETFTLPKSIFLLVSPFFRSLLKSQPPCETPEIIIPDVASGSIKNLLELFQNLQDPDYNQTLTLEELRDLDDLFEMFKVDTNFFKISIKNSDEINNEGVSLEIKDSNVFETFETIAKDEDNEKEYFKIHDSYGFESLVKVEENEDEAKDENYEIPKDDLADVFNQLDEFLDNSSPDKTVQEEIENPASDMPTVNKKEVNDDNGLFSCQFCPDEFNQQTLIDHLKIHIEDVSSKDIILVCPVKTCEKNFFYLNKGQTVGKLKQLGHLEEHLRAKHTKIPCSMCTECGKEFFSTMALHYHQRQHLDNTKFYCHDCEHFKKVTLKEFHMIKCKRRYTCPTCSKSFVSKKHLEVHELIHVSEKPFKCKDCPKSFTQKGNLKTHELKKHNKEQATGPEVVIS